MIRILHCIRSVNPAGGGPIEGIRQIGKVHLASGRETEIVTLDSPSDPWVKECPLPVHALGPVCSLYGYTSRLRPWMVKNRTRFNAVILNGLWQYTSFGAWRALAGTDTPYFVYPHGMLDPWFKRAYPFKHLKKWLYWPWAEYRVLRDAAAVLFTSEEERRAARESFWLYRCKERVVAYGIASPGDDPVESRNAVSLRFPELHGKRVMLFFGRIHVKKGCDLLLRAFAKIAHLDPSLHLVFAGPDQTGWAGELKAAAEKSGVAGRVSWTGMLTGDLKWGMFRTAEVFVLPSHQENFGIAVAEALACGTPVLISNKVNIWREILDDDAGLVEPDDQASTDRLLERWLSLSPSQRDAMRPKAHACFEARFEVSRAAASVVNAIQEHQSLPKNV